MSDTRRGTPADQTSFHPVEGGGVLFNAADGRLYALNTAAGLVWLCHQAGESRDDCAAALQTELGLDQQAARLWADNSLRSFGELNLLASEGAVAPAEAPPPRVRARQDHARSGPRYTLFGRPFSVTAPAAFAEGIAGLLGACVEPSAGGRAATSPEPVPIEVVASADGWNVVVDGERLATCASDAVVPEIERHLIQAILPDVPHLLALHAAALQRGETTLLLAGPSGSGKTTLSIALAREGWNFASDELVLLGRDHALQGLPLPPCVKESGFPLVQSWFAALSDVPSHRRYQRTVKYLPTPVRALQAGAATVLFPSYKVENSVGLQQIDGFSGLARLLSQCVYVPQGFGHNDVTALLDWHRTLRYFELAFDETREAMIRIEEAVRTFHEEPGARGSGGHD